MAEYALKNEDFNRTESAASNDMQGPSLKQKAVLIIDDEPGIRNFLQKGMEKRFGLVERADDIPSAIALTERCNFDLIIADIRLPGQSGVEWVTQLREQGGTMAVIFITAHASVDTAIDALRAGAADFILKPFRMDQIMSSVERCMDRQQLQRENVVLRREVEQLHDSGMVGQCQTMKHVCGVIKRIAPMPTTVLIEGESGTGKELAARAIHQWSGRSGSFVPINCGAITAELMESELFGHVKGAFTGAHQVREGLFTYANNGTLFLDEIGEMPLPMQVHLLRVLEEQTIRPVGSNREVPVDVRIIAATNRDLKMMVGEGNFREDFFYRLNVFPIFIPPLRERRDDIPRLLYHFLKLYCRQTGKPIDGFSDDALEMLVNHDWPGNVRQLKNVVERLVIISDDRILNYRNLSDHWENKYNNKPNVVPKTLEDLKAVKQHLLENQFGKIEKAFLQGAFAAAEGNIALAARQVGMQRSNFSALMKKHGLAANSFHPTSGEDNRMG